MVAAQPLGPTTRQDTTLKNSISTLYFHNQNREDTPDVIPFYWPFRFNLKQTTMNDLEQALTNNDELTYYLSEVSIDDFRKHINEIKTKYADKGAIKAAIEELHKLL